MTLAGIGHAQMPGVGTLIEGRAEAIYVNTRLGVEERIQSNTVTTVVNAYPALEVDRDQTALVSPGVIDQFVFFIENIGNVPLNPVLSITQQGGDEFNVQSVQVFQDLSGNGVVETNEPELPPGTSFSLGIGARSAFIVRFQVPGGGLFEGDQALFDVSASDVGNGVQDEAVGTAIVAEGGLLISKSADQSEADPGGPVSYRLALRNNGTSAIQPYNLLEGQNISVDGDSTINGVLVRDEIPELTVLESIDASVNFRPLYKLSAATDKHTYVTSPPADPADIEAVAFIYDPDSNLATADAYPSGFATDLGFTVRVSGAPTAPRIRNQAETYQPITGQPPVPRPSNPVETPIAEQVALLRWVETDRTTDIEKIGADDVTGANAYLSLEAALCDANDTLADTVAITVRTTPEDDLEIVQAIETGPDTGLFHSPAVSILRQVPAVQNNGVLTGYERTLASASIVCGGVTMTDALVINDGGFVFDSANNDPVPNATVRLMDASGGAMQSVQTTGTGFYSFSDVQPGAYSLAVVNAPGYVFPSERTDFAGFARQVDPAASYGNAFSIPVWSASFGTDVPLDSGVNGEFALTLRKSADKDTAGFGDFVEYRIELSNDAGSTLDELQVEDLLPPGFAYVAGSTRLDRNALNDPGGAPGVNLTFDLAGFELPADQSAELTYVARVLATTGEGNRTNAATASGALPTGERGTSNIARHTIRVDNSGGVFASEGVVVGTVWLDVNGNGIRDSFSAADVAANDRVEGALLSRLTEAGDAGTTECRQGSDGSACDAQVALAAMGGERQVAEPGVPGVRIYTQDGRFAITDADGRYSLPGLAPHTHVFAVERATLPAGTSVRLSRARDALRPGSRFVDVKRGELRSEDFPIGPATSAALSAVLERIAGFEGKDPSEALTASQLLLESVSPADPGTARIAERGGDTRIVNRNGRDEYIAEALPAFAEAKHLERTVDLQTVIEDLSPALGFVDLEDGDTVSDDRISIRVKGPAPLGLALEVNGERVSTGQVGQRVVYAAGEVQAAEFVAVALRSGANQIRLIQTDPFGNDRGSVSITIYAPGEPTGLDVIVPSVGIADPATPLPVYVRVTDRDGRLTGTPIEVTLEASRGSFDVTDIRDAEPGVQAFVDDGDAVFYWIPPSLSGSHTITVRSSLGDYSATVKLTPDLSTRLAAGIIEGAVRFGEGGESLAPLVEDDQLSSFEDTVEGVNGALYLKGRIKGDALLTLRYDSDRDSDDRLFRDVSPDEYYPVYGDNAERGFDAQSNSSLYVKVEKGLSYILYGDINAGPQSDAFELGGYSRALTGGHAHLENDRVRIDLFAAYTDQNQIIREIPARGISGPYDVDLDGYIDNSETVEIVTFDRDQPSVELRRIRLTRFEDYTLDFFDGAILFQQPVPSVDEDLNPQVIRISYEVDDGNADQYWVYGGEISVDVTDELTVGYREMRSEADAQFDDRRTVRAGYAELDLGRFGKLEAEVAQTENRLGEVGEGWRAEYELSGKRGRLRIEAAETDAKFDAPQSSVAEGRREVHVEAEVTLTERIDAEGELLYTEDKITSEVRYGGEARIEARINDHFEVIGGGRYVRTERPGQADDEVISGIAGLIWRPASKPGAVLKVEYEQDFVDADRRRILTDASYRYNENMRVYSVMEWGTSNGGEFGIGDSDTLDLISRNGVEITWSEHLSTKTEHREGADGGLANQIDWTWRWREWHKFSAAIEHVQPLETFHRRNTAIALGYRYENQDKTRLFEQQLEWSLDEDDDSSWYASTQVGQRFDDWTVLAQNRFALTDGTGGQRIRNRTRIGYAWRPVDSSRWVSLGWYGLEYDEDNAADDRELIHTWSVGAEHQLRDDLRIRARHAGRVNQQTLGALDVGSTTLLFTGGAEWDVHERVTVGANASIFWDDLQTVSYGVGGEIGFVPVENTMVSVGYNWAGLDEDRIRDIHRTGFFLRVRAKIDEGIWNVFDRVGVSGQ